MNPRDPRLRRSKQMLEVEAKYGKPLPELLRELHRELGSHHAVAEYLGIPSPTVYYWFRKFDVPLNRFMVPEEVQVPA